MADQDLPLPPDPDDRAPVSSARRWLFGCGCGCAVILLLLAGGLMVLFRNLMGPGVQLPSDHLLGPETVAAIQLDAPTADAEARGFLIDALRALVAGQVEAGADEATTQELEQLLDTLRDLETAGTDFGPRSFTLVAAPVGDELATAFAFNLDRGAAMVRMGLEYTLLLGATEHERDGHTAYEVTGELDVSVEPGATDQSRVDVAELPSMAIGFQHDTAIFGDSVDLVLDILTATAFDEVPGNPRPSPLRSGLAELRDEWLLAAVVRDDPRLDLAGLLAPGEEAGDLDLAWTEAAFATARLGLGVEELDLVLRLEVDGLAPEDLEAVRNGLGQLAAAHAADLADEGLELPYEVLAGEDSLLLQARITGLREWLEQRASLPEPVE